MNFTLSPSASAFSDLSLHIRIERDAGQTSASLFSTQPFLSLTLNIIQLTVEQCSEPLLVDGFVDGINHTALFITLHCWNPYCIITTRNGMYCVVQALIECFMTLVDKSLRVTRGSGHLGLKTMTSPFVSIYIHLLHPFV